jgi:betaine-aldehyde dehydrogenase
VGDPFDSQTQMGPLVSQRHLDRVAGYVTRGVQEGAQLLVGGARPEGPGSFIEPAVFSGTNDLAVAREEIFGPVTIVIPFDDDDEAVQLANDTQYGLAAYVWTRDLARGLRVIGDLRAGSVWMNTTGMPDTRLPWGGMKGSGIGRELGPNGIEAFTEEKSVTVLL